MKRTLLPVSTSRNHAVLDLLDLVRTGRQPKHIFFAMMPWQAVRPVLVGIDHTLMMITALRRNILRRRNLLTRPMTFTSS